MSTVKPASPRAARARETRRRMVSAAHDLFVREGYGATSLQDVAQRAGVAVQTIYFTFGSKRALLKEVVDVAIAGDDEPVATLQRPWFRGALAAETAEQQLSAYVRGTRAVLDRVAAITEVLRTAAATDPEVATMWPQDDDPRLTVQLACAKVLVRKPGARSGLTAAAAADQLYALLSPQVYLLMVRERGWTPARYERWAYRSLRTMLCGP